MTDRTASESLLAPTAPDAPAPSRRGFLRLAACGAAGLLASRVPAAQAEPAAYTRLMAEADACKKTGDMAGMAAAIRKALAEWEGTEYAWRSLAWSLKRAGEFEESLQVARANIGRHGETPWTLAQLGDSALGVHDAELTTRVLRSAGRIGIRRDNPALPALRDVHLGWLGMFGVKRISVTWTAETDGLDHPGNLLWVRLPQMRHPRQDVRYEVLSGVAEPTRVQSREVDYLRVRYTKGAPVVIRTDCVVRPGTYPLATLRKTVKGHVPAAVAHEYLGKSDDCPIDPFGPQCKSLIAELRGATHYETIDHIMRWMRDNFRYIDNRTQDSEGLLIQHFGVCHHYSVVIVALCRAAGIPARIVGGEVFGWNGPNDETVACGGSHGWVEVYLHPLGWVELDGLGYGSFGATQRDLGVYLRFHNVGHLGNPILPYEWSMQGFTKIEGRLLGVTPYCEL